MFMARPPVEFKRPVESRYYQHDEYELFRQLQMTSVRSLFEYSCQNVFPRLHLDILYFIPSWSRQFYLTNMITI